MDPSWKASVAMILSRLWRAPAGRALAVTRGDLQLLKKYIRHVGIVMLAGMNEGLLYLGVMLERAQHGREFHKIRPGTHYVKNVHTKSPDVECTLTEVWVNCPW